MYDVFMDAIYAGLVVAHGIGAVLGVGAATFAEIYYTRFNRDNIIDEGEAGTLKVTYTTMRLGLFVLVISGFGFLLYYRLTGQVEPLLSSQFLAKMTIVGVLVGNALLLQARVVPMVLGTAISLTSWYAAFILGLLHLESFPYLPTMLFYVAAIPVVMLALQAIRARLHAPEKP